MLTVLLLLIIAFILIIKYAKQAKQRRALKWPFIQLINKLSGPRILETLAEIEVVIRKHACKYDHSIICLWFDFKPTLVLAKSQSAEVIFENTTHKTDDYDFSKSIQLMLGLMFRILNDFGTDSFSETTMDVTLDAQNPSADFSYIEP
uniref:Inner membrane protein n=1 Tax=Elaeophora elaphi TaxID=1147741 RepID=A0A0R3RIY5_9BILA